jgi:hypothetical protein
LPGAVDFREINGFDAGFTLLLIRLVVDLPRGMTLG